MYYYIVFLSRGKGERKNKHTVRVVQPCDDDARRWRPATWQRCVTTPHVTTGRLHKKHNNNNKNNKRARRSRRRAWLARRRRRLHSVYTHAHPPDEMCFFFPDKPWTHVSNAAATAYEPVAIGDDPLHKIIVVCCYDRRRGTLRCFGIITIF